MVNFILSKTKKAELTTEMLIGLLIAIIIIILLIFIFMGKINFFKNNTTCESQNGACKKPVDCIVGRIYSATCPQNSDDTTLVCCLKEDK